MIVKTLCKMLEKAQKGLQLTQEAFESLNDGLSEALISKWKRAEAKAMKKRGTYLKCYDVTKVKTASMSEIQIALLGQQGLKEALEGGIAWIAEGIAIEATQSVRS